ncbi:MAG: aldehyde dehydrogenase family protein [Deltaproteobacteria bacterium]|nr:aldehyde dehydrogenase family protein [Deltaproteobacteria bacterium]
MANEPKITYTTLLSSESFHADYEQACRALEGRFGALHRNVIASAPSESSRVAEVHAPHDTRLLLGRVQRASAKEASLALSAAHAAFPAWRDTPWRARAALLRQAAERLRARRTELAALMSFEVGKNRFEAMGEAEESVDLIEYYCSLLERHDGYREPMNRLGADEENESVYRPYGAWTVIAPFNFPAALSVGMISAALLAGNTVVYKPAEQAPLTGHLLFEVLAGAGLPPDVLQLVCGDGEEAGQALVSHPLCAGVAFTGSYAVGMQLYRSFGSDYPKPMVIEMGGKNPAIVLASADLDAAAEGVMRSSMGYGGQKCSACSRAYVAREVLEPFLDRLVARVRGLTVGPPTARETFLGPLISAQAKVGFAHHVARARAEGHQLLVGGDALSDERLAHGHYVPPTVVRCRDGSSALFHEELFAPLLLVAPVADLDEALTLANAAPYGLTAGLFSRVPAEIEYFLANIEAGVTYVNRRSGATTGAWPGVNPFGGWKASGSTGPAGLGPNYLLRFLREQSRTRHAY